MTDKTDEGSAISLYRILIWNHTDEKCWWSPSSSSCCSFHITPLTEKWFSGATSSVPLSSCDFYLINRQFLVPVTDLFIHPVAGNPRASREDGGTSSSGAPAVSWRYPVARGESVGVIIVQHGYSSPRRFVSLCSVQFSLLVIDLLTDWIQCSSSWGHRRGDGVDDLDDDGCCDAHQ